MAFESPSKLQDDLDVLQQGISANTDSINTLSSQQGNSNVRIDVLEETQTTQDSCIADLISRVQVLESGRQPAPPTVVIQGFAETVTGGEGFQVIDITSPENVLGNIGSNRVLNLQFSGTVHLDDQLTLNSISNLTINADGYQVDFRSRNNINHAIRLSGCNNIWFNNFAALHGIKNQNRDVINMLNCNNIALTNMSIRWGTDECLGITGCHDITIQDCLIAECLLPHSTGVLVREECGNINFIRTLFAHNNSRQPQISHDAGNGGLGRFDVSNCVHYNEGIGGAERASLEFKKSLAEYNVVGNHYIAGPNKMAGKDFANACIGGAIYESDNIAEGVSLWLRPNDETRRVSTEFIVPQSILDARVPSTQVKSLVSMNAGRFPRDISDTRIVNEVNNHPTTGPGNHKTDIPSGE